ncbi:MAG: hypothetical protein QUV07_05050 [Cyanobium sp. CZS 25K]|nr:hypothetical protein [Cyanobium sp. CZS25K]
MANLLVEGEAAVAAIPQSPQQLALWLRLALLQGRHGVSDLAQASLLHARRSVEAASVARREALLLRFGLAYAEHGEEKQAGRAVAESEQLHRAAAERTISFPFPEGKLEGRVGLAMSAATYEETTANAVASFDLYKQWPRNDFEVDLFVSINYDSSRDFNLTWPISQGFAVYRHRLDRHNFLFIDQLVAVNDSTFSTQDDDDDDGDVSVLFSTLFGYGYNFWQGADPSSFQAVQLGVGPRYEYAEINLTRQRDQVDPIAALVYRSRDVPIGPAKWSQVFALATPVNSFDEAFLWSSTRLDWPITRQWMWTNRLSLRYRSRSLEAGFKRLNVILSTGLTCTF